MLCVRIMLLLFFECCELDDLIFCFTCASSPSGQKRRRRSEREREEKTFEQKSKVNDVHALGEIVSFFCGHANANDSLHIRVSKRGSLLLRRQLPLLLCRSSLRRALCL